MINYSGEFKVKVELQVDETKEKLLPDEEIKENVRNINSLIKKELVEIADGNGTVEVTEISSSLTKNGIEM